MLQHFIIQGQLLGSTDRTWKRVHGEVQLPYAYAFFCRQCCDIWARCPIDNQPQWHIVGAPCHKHSDSPFDVPGSVWSRWEREWNDALPDAVIEREFHLHLKLMESV